MDGVGKWFLAIDMLAPVDSRHCGHGVTMIWGRDDPCVSLSFGERLAERMKAELVVLDCGHWWPYERPAETAEALQRLSAGVTPAV